MKSLSEIDTTSKRASRAAGFSWGVSEEIGKSIRLLELFGLQGVKILNQYYQTKPNQKYENLSLINQKNTSEKNPYCPIILGISFLDQIKSIEKFKIIIFNKVAFPLLMIPFLSRSSEIIGKRVFIKFNNIEFLLNLNVNISSNILNKNCPLLAENVEVRILENEDSFSDEEWKSLYKLSEETFVEETDSLKEGAAGAGLTDND
ncbi:DUF3726 domain-containing protein [Candidatus Pelagibacter sp. HIMB1321]|uniref:DUF3726 domain-containing protein n=1 Tax=Candidatus Pelagibacter sp. HIMB1321 TaxID=1388755 RepID=UPI000A081923|nr:DUF3726 domain-containing protein [Candidatus Pelagibacter sp. HIMB1321]SMF78014.1 Protein of unknown function [Candidatus Pelagibacter sp. HIMB1321]